VCPHFGTDNSQDDDPETTTINIPVAERQLEETDAVWNEEGYSSRGEFPRHATRDATDHPGVSRSMLASIAAEEYAVRNGETETVSREETLALFDSDE
jgi:hypothetical protein